MRTLTAVDRERMERLKQLTDGDAVAIRVIEDRDGNTWEYFIAGKAAGRAAALDEAAKVCENVSYPLDITEWGGMTKKEHAVRACTECAAAIRALKEGK